MPRKIVILTGAGISAESGIRTFRDQGGLWEDHRIEDVASIEGFVRNPSLVQNFYNERRRQLLLPEIKPNPAHLALVELEKVFCEDFLLITQNVDDLHGRAGNRNLIHMHGELLKVRCLETDEIFSWREPILENTECQCCGRTKTLRPHIVWFGEIPFEMDRIIHALESCDCFIAIGTSGNVYPAAGFVQMVPERARKIEVNLVSTRVSEARVGPASVEVPKLVKELLSKTE